MKHRSALIIVLTIALMSPLMALAAATDGGVGSSDPKANDTRATPDPSSFQLVSCTGVKDPRTGQGVECDYAQLVATANRIIRFVLYIITPLVLCMLVYTGFKYVTAGGDANLIADAKRMFTPILIGLFLIFAAWTIVYTVLDKLLAENVGGVSKSDIISPN